MAEGERREFFEWFNLHYEGEEIPRQPILWKILGKFWSDYHRAGSVGDEHRIGSLSG